MDATISAKYSHPSGFSLDKLEANGKLSLVTETSLVGTFPGLKFEFKANDTTKADLGFVFNHHLATVTGELDVNSLSKANASVSFGQKNVVGGAAVDVSFAKGVVTPTFNAGLGYSADKVFAAVRASKNFTELSAIASYAAAQNWTLVSKVARGVDSVNTDVGVVYHHDPKVQWKAKVSSKGAIDVSYKRNVTDSVSVVATAVITSALAPKFGLSATLA